MAIDVRETSEPIPGCPCAAWSTGGTNEAVVQPCRWIARLSIPAIGATAASVNPLDGDRVDGSPRTANLRAFATNPVCQRHQGGRLGLCDRRGNRVTSLRRPQSRDQWLDFTEPGNEARRWLSESYDDVRGRRPDRFPNLEIDVLQWTSGSSEEVLIDRQVRLDKDTIGSVLTRNGLDARVGYHLCHGMDHLAHPPDRPCGNDDDCRRYRALLRLGGR